jgi:hypothetical protein
MSRTLAFIFLVIALSGYGTSARAAQTSPYLTVVAGHGVTQTGPGAGRYDFGEVDSLVRPKVSKVFTLRNDQSTPVTIGAVRSSCACASMLLAESKNSTTTVAPGKEVHLKVVLDVAGLPPALLDKAVWAYGPAGGEPLATLRITAMPRPLICTSSATLDFGSAQAGKERSLTLTAELDARLFPSAGGPKLMSTNADVQVRQTGSDSRRSGTHGNTVMIRTYTVTLQPGARLGPISGGLRFSPPPIRDVVQSPVGRGSTKVATIPYANVVSALKPVQVILFGQVLGSVTAQPSAVYFGGVFQGKGASQKVLLRGQSQEDLAKLVLLPGPSWVTARIRPAAGGDLANVLNLSGPGLRQYWAVLEADLDPKVKPAVYQGELTVKTGAGERLVLPVSAYVMTATDPGSTAPPRRLPPRRIR